MNSRNFLLNKLLKALEPPLRPIVNILKNIWQKVQAFARKYLTLPLATRQWLKKKRQWWHEDPRLNILGKSIPLRPRFTRVSIIHRYIIKECIGPFLVGTAFFTFVLVVVKLKDLVELFMEKATPLSVTLELFVYMLPFTAAVTIPMGVLFGILMAFGNFSAHSEIIAMRSNGISIYKIFAPAAVFGVVVTIGMFFFLNYLMPETNYRYRRIYREIVYSNPGIMLEERVFADVPDSKPDYIKKVSTVGLARDGKKMQSVFIYENDHKNAKVKITYAETGAWSNNDVNSQRITLLLNKGRTLEVGWKDLDEIQSGEFESFKVNIKNDVREVKDHDRGLREKSFLEVYKDIHAQHEKNSPVNPRMWVEFHKKFSIPAACFIFVLIGMPLGISFRRSGKGISFGSAIIIIFIYYMFMTVGETFGKRQQISEHLAMWLPNIVVLLMGIIIFIKRARE